MKRARTTIGDIYSVKIDSNHRKYFQFVASDITQLNSDVIRAFKKIYTIDEMPSLQEIIGGEVEFYAHCIVKWGIQLGFWQKVGNIKEVGTVGRYFKSTNDDQRVKVSQNWWVWKINEEHRFVGKLEGEYRDAEEGSVIPPDSIVYRMRTGTYNFVYPGFE